MGTAIAVSVSRRPQKEVTMDRTIDVRTVYESVILIHKVKIDQKLFILLFNKVCEDIRDRYKEKYIVPQNMAYRPVDSLNDATTVYADYTSALEEGILYYAGAIENKNKYDEKVESAYHNVWHRIHKGARICGRWE